MRPMPAVSPVGASAESTPQPAHGAGGGACGDGLGVGAAGAGLGAVDGVGAEVGVVDVVDVVVVVGVGEVAEPPPPSGMAMCPSSSMKETGLPPARAYRFWVSGSTDRPRLDRAPKNTSGCWKRPVFGPNRRAPMSRVAEPPALVAVPESIRLAEYRNGLSGVWLSGSPVVSDWVSESGASCPP